MSEWLLYNAKWRVFSATECISRLQVVFLLNYDNVCFVLNTTRFNSWIFIVYIYMSLKQQSEDRHATPLGHNILILRRPVSAFTFWYCMIIRKATNTNCIVFVFYLIRLEHTIYSSRDKHANIFVSWTLNHRWMEKEIGDI
jgi:hypothetical protein